MLLKSLPKEQATSSSKSVCTFASVKCNLAENDHYGVLVNLTNVIQ